MPLIEQEIYDEEINLIALTDAVIGGANGVANKGPKGLANRTKWLRARLVAAGLAGSAREYTGDLNELRTTGSFLIRGSAANRPEDFSGHLEVIAADQPDNDPLILSATATHVYYAKTGNVWTRQYAGTWSNWDQVVTQRSIADNNFAPVGCIQHFAGTLIPNGWLKCEGQTLQVEDYPALFQVFGSPGGVSATEFTLPDCRGRVMKTAAAGDTIRGTQDGRLPDHRHAVSVGSPVTVNTSPTGVQVLTPGSNGTLTSGGALALGGSPNGPWAAGGEVRVASILVHTIIRY